MRAADLFAERGLDSTKIDDIAAVTGVPQATLYYYFEGKEEILSYIFGVVLDAVGSAVTRALAGPGNGAERLTRAIDAHLGVFADYPRASQALHFDLGRAARRPEIAARTASAYVDPIASVLRAGADDGSLRRVDDPRLSAVALLGATSTAAIHALALDPTASDLKASLREVAGAVRPLVLEGLRSAPASSGEPTPPGKPASSGEPTPPGKAKYPGRAKSPGKAKTPGKSKSPGKRRENA